MTTRSWSTPFNGTNTAGYSAAIAELSAKLDEIGLVKVWTDITDYSNIPRPASSGLVSGKEVRAFADSLQATAPIFILFEFTVPSTSISSPGFYTTVGNQHDGAGVVTGGVETARIDSGTSSGTGAGTGTALPSYACHAEGHFTLAWKTTWGQNQPFIHVSRFSDDDGTPNDDGYTVFRSNASSTATIGHINVQAVRTVAPAQAYGANANGCTALWVHGLTGSSADTDGNLQTMPVWTLTKKAQQCFSIVSYTHSEVVQGTTFALTAKGPGPDATWIGLGNAAGLGGLGASDARFGVRWE
jgi:hypothetical protein